jgi:hypothetical protein
MKSRTDVLNEIRYSERICERTARFYRHIQTTGVFLSILSGSATISAVSSSVPHWVSISGALILTITGAALIAIAPSEKAVANETDQRKYATLRAEAHQFTDDALIAALDKARQSDVAEIEAMRDIAFNDVVIEYGRSDCVHPLPLSKRILAVLA